MNIPKDVELPGLTDKQKIAVLGHTDLAVNSENFEGVYLLSEEVTLVHKEEISNLSLDFKILKLAIVNAIKVFPLTSELVFTYQDHRVVVRPLVSKRGKGEPIRIPGVSYIVFILPLTKRFRGLLSKLTRDLLAPFKKREKKSAEDKTEEDEAAKKRIAQKVLDDLKEI